MNFLACNGSYIYVDNNLKILSSVSPGYLTNFPFVTLQLWKRQCKLQMRVLVFGSRTFLIVMSSSSNSLSMFNRFSINLRTQDIIASDAVVTVKIENISATRFYSLCNNDSRLWLLPNITNLCFFFFGELNPRQSPHRNLPFTVFFGGERSMRLL